MADREYTISVMKRLHEKPSDDTLRKFNDDNAGISCMLKYLSDTDEPVSAGEISRFMRVSTARVSVLLKKMQEKNFIVRENCSEDARRLMISLSDEGRAECLKRREEMIELFSRIIDEVGRERMEEFISISHQMKKVVEKEIKKYSAE
ncbi:MAG: MarR family transcriptional regulator [Ruminococcus flavefaciens]|nr:MarR family transcriptional regulator [Ruminococcus flavefaciens]